jgi:hypothetical protein
MRTAAAFLITLSLAACQKDVEPEKPKGPPQPDDVIAVVSASSVGEPVSHIQQYAEAMRPGSGAAITLEAAKSGLAQAIGATSIEGIALDKPLHLIVLDPKKHPRPLLLLGTGDAATLQPGGTVVVKGQDGHALLGDKAAVELCSAWALGSLASQQAPASPTARASLRKLVERYRAEIEQGKQAMAQTMMAGGGAGVAKIIEIEIDLLIRLAAQTEEVQVVMDASATEAWLELGFTPTPGSGFEAFNKAQRPAPAALLSRLPGTPAASMLMTGYYELGPLKGLLYDLMGETMASWAGVKADDAFRKRWGAAMAHFKGPFAVSSNQGAGPTSMQQLFAVDDGPATIAAMKEFLPWKGPKTIDAFGMMKMQITPREAAATHDGVTIDEMTIRFDLSSMSAQQQQMMRMMYGEEARIMLAGFDEHVAVTWGPNALPDMQRTIDMARRGPAVALSPGSKAAFDAAAGRKASYVAFMNMASTMAAVTGRTIQTDTGFSMELLFPEGRAAMRMGLPAAHLRAIIGSVSQ